MRVRAPLPVLAAVPLALVALVGCGASADETTETSSANGSSDAFPVTIEHTFGETTIEEQPERVVVLGWSAQDTVYALGLDPVGMPSYVYGGGDDGVLPWNEDLYDPEVTTLLDTADGPPLEAIAALQPDVILAPYEGFEESVYDSLSGIAPTVAYPGEPWTTPWREQTRMIGEALGRSAEAEELITEADGRVAEIAAEHPEFEGLTFAYTSMGAEALYLYLPTDPRVQLIEDLGFTVAPAVETLGGDSESSFYAQLALESAPDIESDVIVGFADGLSAEEVAALPIYGQVPAIQDDAAVLIDDESFGAAVSSVSVLSLPYALDQLVDQLAAAAENAR
ncbi:iron-siderophore ABC transporter substrate-binding protein [Blastococcus jejuensis]|uniref:Iron-siderophore ABC transporter substrate-binding protein n=1 Tax=Blastococcus jejuensis TaxID=351224 RepID=A0ABP6PJ92_9ACTN